MPTKTLHKYRCSNPDCTVADTGRCLESYENPGTCPHCNIEKEEDEHGISSDHLVDAPSVVNEEEKPARRFFSGFEIGLSEASELMSLKYTKIIGIIGASGVGKTCLLSSLYLLMANNELYPDYVFAGSLTLPGFEDRARHLRQWSDGLLPDKLADHTALQDDRVPAFLHLAIHCSAGHNSRHEFLFSDLPGEWTSGLIERNERSGRFDFLKRADGLIYVLDGKALSKIEQKNVEIHKAKLLLDRLAMSLNIYRSIPFVIVVSKIDLIPNYDEASVCEVVDYAKKYGFTPSVSLVSAFSSIPGTIRSGSGVKEILESLTSNENFDKSNGLKSMHDYCRAYGRYLG